MKRIFGLVGSLVLVFSASAQEETTFSDDDLKKYAAVMVWAEQAQDELGNVVRDSVGIWLDESGVLDASGYNELSKASKSGSLDGTEASEEEVAVFEAIQARIEEKKDIFKETYTTKIKEDIGAGLYNDLRKALKSDDEVKDRYTVILEALKVEAEAVETDTDAG